MRQHTISVNGIDIDMRDEMYLYCSIGLWQPAFSYEAACY